MQPESHHESHALQFGVRADIFRNILKDSRLQAWEQPQRRWQLHISGGPGSGKVSPSNYFCTV